eukprot:10705814-Ditylum_brightwellii.AAC.1
MNDVSKSKETTSDMMDCNGMPGSEPAKDDDMSSNELSIEDIWEGYTIKSIANVKGEYCQECIKNPKCLELLKEYVAKNEDVQHIYEDIEKQVINATTDDDSSSSSSSSVSSSAKKVGMFLVRNVKFKKSSSPD